MLKIILLFLSLQKNMANISFTMIKPDAFSKGYAGLIINDIIQNGFKIKALKLKKLSLQEAERILCNSYRKTFFKELTTFMSSGTNYSCNS